MTHNKKSEKPELELKIKGFTENNKNNDDVNTKKISSFSALSRSLSPRSISRDYSKLHDVDIKKQQQQSTKTDLDFIHQVTAEGNTKLLYNEL
eukprot:383979_1